VNLICTIIAKNYLPQALALRDSVQKVYPGRQLKILVSDGVIKNQSPLEGIDWFSPFDLSVDSKSLTQMYSYYDLFEISTALKPFFLRKLLEQEDVASVTFLDPDVVLFDRIDQAFQIAQQESVVLCPHRLTPSNLKSNFYHELVFLKYGVFNLGFISVGRNSIDMLEWWGERTKWFCSRYANEVWFTDQKWVDLVPALFSNSVIRDFGFNVAPWNIDERPISIILDDIYAGPDKLKFLHFSQMSSLLARGVKVNHWENGLNQTPVDDRSATRSFIEGETARYSKKLMSYVELIRTEPLLELEELPTGKSLSFHRRRIIMNKLLHQYRAKSLMHQEIGSIQSIKQARLGGRFSSVLEKSSTLNGLRDGIRDDVSRLLNRIR